MIKTPVKFQKDRHKTVEGVAHTRYLLLEGGWKQGKPNTMSPLFSSKRRGTKRIFKVVELVFSSISEIVCSNMMTSLLEFEHRLRPKMPDLIFSLLL